MVRNFDFVNTVVEEAENADWLVDDIKIQKKNEQPRAPFITSTLQRAASTELYFSAKYTMSLAQALYEGVNVGEGPVGLITYMRTDSVRIADEAVNEARDYISQKFGDKYLPDKPRKFKSKSKSEQDAHEAVRPTSVLRDPDSISQHFKSDKKSQNMLKLYRIIWRQFVACQMSAHVYNQITVSVKAAKSVWKCFGREEIFDGFTKLYKAKLDENSVDETQKIPDLKVNEKLQLLKIATTEKATQPLPRFNEASLVKTLEAEGIGRPSTYATILSNIQDRGYVELRERKFFATELGMHVNDLLIEHFPREMSYDFTSNMEQQLDLVEDGTLPHIDIIRNFWAKFEEDLLKAEKEMKSVRGKDAEITETPCSACQKLAIST